MKRANGTGSIIHRKDKKRRLPFSVYLDGGCDPDTFRRRRIFLGSFATHREAQNYLEQYRQGVVVQPTNETQLREVWELYTDDQKALGKTVPPNYYSAWKNHIEPKLGSVAMSQIKTMHMQNVINNCKGPGSQRHVKAVFYNLYRYALANDVVMKDYSASLKVQDKEVSTMHKPFTMEELGQLWQRVNEDNVKIILIQTYTGMRMSELSGIRMENVHLKERYMVGGLKTAAGKNRTIPIADCILPLVQHFYTISLFARYDYLIMPDNARGIRSLHGRVDMGKIYRKAFPAHTTHDARHTFVTMCEDAGIRPATIKKIVGHTGGVTEDIYTHKSIDQLLEAVNSLPHGPNLGTRKNGSGVATG